MEQQPSRAGLLIYVLVAASCVYVLANREAFTNPFLINDDVRQQIYWMQQWQDPELFQNDLLTEYAKEYVPPGIKVIYRVASLFVSPLLFTNILTGILFVITAGFLFGLGLEFQDDLTAVLVVCVYFLFAGFLGKMAGGLSRTFVWPLLTAYLFFLARNRPGAAGNVILAASLLNPYAFLLCFSTHGIFLLHSYGKDLVRCLVTEGPALAADVKAWVSRRGAAKSAQKPKPWATASPDAASCRLTLRMFMWWNVPVLIGLLVLVIGHVVLPSNSFGTLVSRADMAGMVEYSAQGRYQIQPVPSFVSELIRPWIFDLPFREWGAVAGWVGVLLLIGLLVFALRHWQPVVSWSGLRIFCYLVPASLVLYVLACIFLMKLFVPRRYIEYTLNLFYCMGTAVCIRVAIENLQWRRIAFPLLTTILVLFAIVRLHNLELYDYSGQKDLYRFLQSTPKASLIAGHPELMDNIPTFARRKAFVTYELSHTWIQPYWNTIKKRTFELFKAYYADDPEAIRDFCRKYGITYFIVRDEDFPSKKQGMGRVYFAPFDSYIRNLVGNRTSFAILDPANFPPIYQKNGIRVLQVH
jgi:hypothetical protein